MSVSPETLAAAAARRMSALPTQKTTAQLDAERRQRINFQRLIDPGIVRPNAKDQAMRSMKVSFLLFIIIIFLCSRLLYTTHIYIYVRVYVRMRVWSEGGERRCTFGGIYETDFSNGCRNGVCTCIAQTLLTLSENLLRDPENEKFKKFKPTNSIIKRDLMDAKGALEYAIEVSIIICILSLFLSLSLLQALVRRRTFIS